MAKIKKIELELFWIPDHTKEVVAYPIHPEKKGKGQIYSSGEFLDYLRSEIQNGNEITLRPNKTQMRLRNIKE